MQETRARSVGWVLIDFGTGFGEATSGINSAAEEYRPVLRSAANQFGLYVVFSHLRSLNFLTLCIWIEPFMHIAQTHLNFRSMENGKDKDI